MKLIIKETSWSGWKKDYKPIEVEKEYDVELNKKYVIKTYEESYVKDGNYVKEKEEIFSFDIIEINDGSIKIHTYQSFLSNDSSTNNIRNDKQDFVINTENPLKLITPTRDHGDIFIIKLIK